MFSSLRRSLFCALSAVPVFGMANASEFSVWCDNPNSRYECGEKAVFNVHSSFTNGIAHVRLDNFGSRVLKEFDVDLSKKRDFSIEGERDIPGFLLLTVTCGKTVKRWGAAFSPEKISAGAPCPADFVKFWHDAVRDYDRKVREDVKLERIDSLATNGCDVYMLSLSDPEGRKVYGFLKTPKDLSRAPYPVQVFVPGGGPSVGTPSWKGGNECVELMMNVHYYRPIPGESKRGNAHRGLQKEEDKYYENLYPATPKHSRRYAVLGIAASREEYFFYGAILAINRAVNWLRSQSYVDPDNFSYLGGSQGGGIGLALVALNGKFKKALFGVPALTAHLCHLIDGREAGWPRLVESQNPENRAAAIKNAPYFDGVNFATMITCPAVFSVGYADVISPPHAGYAAFNACPAKEKAMFGSVGFGHRINPDDSARMRLWLENCGQGTKTRCDSCSNDVDKVESLADVCGFNKKAVLDRFPGCEIQFSCSLDELVSGRDEDERYKSCDTVGDDVKLHSSCMRRTGQDAWDAKASVSNLSTRPRFLRLVFRAKVPGEGYKFWNGYLNQSEIAEKLQEQMDYLRMGLFPAIAAVGKDASLALGMDPMMLAARVDTSCVKHDGGEFLQFSFPVYLPPGDGFSARMTLASAPARYLWHDVVETWYGLYPEAFAPADKIHPGLYYPEACYLFWSPRKYGIKRSLNARRKALRKVYKDHPCWDWCYKPFVRGGDWAITDKWSVGWNGYTKEMVEAKRADIRTRMAEGEALNVAPMWYLNVCWTERDMGLKEFPGIEIDSGKTRYRPCWNQPTMRPVYCAGNTPYEKLFRESLERIPKDYPEAKGIGWDSCFAGERLPESHLGFKGTPCKSFRKGVPFGHEAVGVSGLLDFNHEQFSGQYRMANAVNHKLAAPWMITVRSDAILFEGTPVSRPVLLWLHESLRARIGPRKVITWHKGCKMKMLEWAQLDKMSPELRDDAHRQILDDLLFLCYYRGTVPAAMITSENRERLVSGVTELMELIASGWHPSPACDAPEGILVARYGDGAATRLAVINPGYGMRDADLFLPGEYWAEYKDGKKINVSVPARHIVIVNPADGTSRTADILPPAPVRKALDKGLMKWMDENGLLGFVNKD